MVCHGRPESSVGGETLHIWVKIVDVRATAEELEHDHVHGEHDHDGTITTSSI